MAMLKIEISGEMVDALTELIEKLGGEVLAEKLSNEERKQRILDDIEESFEFIKLYKAGKVKAKPIEQLFDELEHSDKYDDETVHLGKSRTSRLRLQEVVNEMNKEII